MWRTTSVKKAAASASSSSYLIFALFLVVKAADRVTRCRVGDFGINKNEPGGGSASNKHEKARIILPMALSMLLPKVVVYSSSVR